MQKHFLDSKFVVSNAVALTSLVLFYFFPVKSFLQGMISVFVFLFLLPALFIKLILSDELKNYGWQSGQSRRNIIGCGLLSLLWAGLLVVLYKYTSLAPVFSLPGAMRLNFSFFLIYSVVVLFHLIWYEFFFRGFILSIWNKKVGVWSLLVQSFWFIAFFWQKIIQIGFDPKFLFLFFLFSFFSGGVAWYTRSVLTSFVFSSLSVILGTVAIIVFS